MARSVYALLVGINDYQGRVNPLAGCIEDVRGFEAFLRNHMPDDQLSVRPLLNRDATRQAIIDGFKTHLSRAELGDSAIFYFSGHGSTEPVEQRFWHLEPTKQNQTMVCFDSRKTGIPDLADKEINDLIGEVASRGPHVLAILDCCHAGGATRDVDVHIRSAPPLTEPRPFGQYLVGIQNAWQADTRDSDSNEGPALAEPPRHVALSACESGQLSKELPIGEGYRGVFSAMLQQALTRLGPGATYRDLMGAASAGVRDKVMQQDPVGYAFPVDALDQALFGGAVQLREHAITLEHYNGQWWIDAGSVHGIQPARGDDTTVLAVLPPADQATATHSQPLGQIRVTEVQLVRCRVAIVGDWQPDPAVRYPTVVVDLPVPAATVEIRADEPGASLVRASLAASPHLREGVGDPGIDGDRFVVLSEPPGHPTKQLILARPDGTDIADALPPTQEGAATLVRRMEHLARWHLIKRLDNPGSAITNKVTIDIVPAEPGETHPPRRGERAPLTALADGLIHLAYRQTGTGWEHPYVWIYLNNDSQRNLYCTLLDLTDRYRCHSKLFPGTLIPAGATTIAFDGRPVDVSIPQQRLSHKDAEVRDWLKLIASELRFAPEGYDLPNLDGVLATRSATRGTQTRTVLDRLADRVVTRDAGDEIAQAPEWTTTLVTLLTHGPTPAQTG
jgi:hypothetical protein